MQLLCIVFFCTKCSKEYVKFLAMYSENYTSGPMRPSFHLKHAKRVLDGMESITRSGRASGKIEILEGFIYLAI